MTLDNLAIIAFVAIGVSSMWARLEEDERLKIVGVSKLLRDVGCKGGLFTVAEFFLFVIIGAAVALVVAEPTTGRQAIAVGAGWTAIFSGQLRKSEAQE